MKLKISLSIFFLIICNLGHCEWVKFATDDIKNEYFYESSKIDIKTYPKSKVIFGWIMMNYGKPFVMKDKNIINSQKDNFQITCKFEDSIESYKVTYSAYFRQLNGKGGMIFQNDYGIDALNQKIVPDSIFEFFVGYFCKM